MCREYTALHRVGSRVTGQVNTGDTGLHAAAACCGTEDFKEQGLKQSCHVLLWLTPRGISSIKVLGGGGNVGVLHSQQSKAEPAPLSDALRTRLVR